MPADTFFAYIGVYANVDDALDGLRRSQSCCIPRPDLIDAYDEAVDRAQRERQGEDRQETRNSDPGGRGGWRAASGWRRAW